MTFRRASQGAFLDENPLTTIDLFGRPGRFFRGNLHTHSTRSDGRYAPDEVCARYRDAGYDFIALTDHFLPAFDFPVTDTRAFRTERFTTLIGAEVHVPATALGEMWHLLAVGLPLDFEPTRQGESAPALATRCAAAGAFVGIVHPAWYGLTAEDANSIDSAHAVEVYNHTSAVKTDRGDGWVLLDQLLAQRRRLGAFASDDAHFHFDDAFGAWVMVQAPSLAPEALVDALKQGHYYSTQGPQIYALRHDGDFVEIECSPASAIFALGRGSKAETELGKGLHGARLPLDKLRRGGHFRMVVVDEKGRRAWSNPYWFDAQTEPTEGAR